MRKEIAQTQTGLTWSKPINDQHEIYAMVYVGQRTCAQYQSIARRVLTNPRHAGGVIDFNRNYYGTDLRWTGKDLLPNTRLTAGLAFDSMDEDRKGYENFDASGNYGVKGNLRRDENNTLWNLDPYVQASWKFLPAWTFDAGLRYSNVHYESKDHYIAVGNGDDSGKTDYDKVLPSAALSWAITSNAAAISAMPKALKRPPLQRWLIRPMTA